MTTQIATMIMGMLGGLGLLLFGMKLLGEGLELVAGPKMRGLIGKLTTNKYMGALLGLIVTAVIQSSSATTVMVVGFVNAGLMSLAQAVGVIMGANIGTTVTGLIIAFNLLSLAPIAIFIGVILSTFFKKDILRSIGQTVIGFGLLFLGLTIMSQSMKPLADMPEFTNILAAVSNPLTGILIGALFTAIVQSSSVSVGVLQAFANAGIITLPNAIYIIYGQNIGTCVTSLLSSIGTNKTAKRTAIVHLLFNVIGTVLFLFITLLLPFEEIIMQLFPNNVMMQISAVHITFNVVGTCIMLPLSNWLIKIACKIIPGEDPKKEQKALMYLDERILNTPSFAVSQVFDEVNRMGALAKKNLDVSMNMIYTGNLDKLKQVTENEEVINFLNHGITEYLIKFNATEIDDKDTESISRCFHVINDIERIGDHSINISNIAKNLEKSKDKLPKDAIEDIEKVYNEVDKLIENAYLLLNKSEVDTEIGVKVRQEEKYVDRKTYKLRKKHIDRLKSGDYSAFVSVQYMDLMANLERVADHANNIAYATLTEEEILKIKYEYSQNAEGQQV